MQEDFRKLTFAEWKELYVQIGSNSLELQSEIAKDITDKQLNLYQHTLDFIYRIASVMGIFAGFGFTGLSYVVNLPLFITGEAILISLILICLYFVPKVYTSEYDGLEKSLKKYNKEVFDPRGEALGRLVETYTEKQGINVKDMEEVLAYDKKLMDMMVISHEPKYSPFQKPINIGLAISIAGLLLVFLSFLV